MGSAPSPSEQFLNLSSKLQDLSVLCFTLKTSLHQLIRLSRDSFFLHITCLYELISCSDASRMCSADQHKLFMLVVEIFALVLQ